MPSIFTHDCFGNDVLDKLPKDLSKVLNKYKKQFRIGLQGPDFLFFYHPLLKLKINQLGHRQHKNPGKDFFKPILPLLRKLGKDSPEYAYAIGFICHFMLDSECHGYVFKKSKQRGFNHLVMEMEFDRYLMKKNGIEPTTFPIYKFVPLDSHTIQTIANVYHKFGIEAKHVFASLRGMRFYKKLLTAGKTCKRFFIRLIMKITFHYKQLEGHMMSMIPKTNSKTTNRALLSRYQKAIDQTVSIIQDFDLHFDNMGPLPERFNCTFENNQMKK